MATLKTTCKIESDKEIWITTATALNNIKKKLEKYEETKPESVVFELVINWIAEEVERLEAQKEKILDNLDQI